MSGVAICVICKGSLYFRDRSNYTSFEFIFQNLVLTITKGVI